GATQAAAFTLSSPTVKPGSTLSDAQVFNGFGCTGKNISPALKWSGAPANTKSFALSVYDPDAPTGSGWWHWVVYNIPASVTQLPAGRGIPERTCCPRAQNRGILISANRAMAARVLRRGTNRITIISAFLRSTPTSSTSPTAPPRRTSVSISTRTVRASRNSPRCTAAKNTHLVPPSPRRWRGGQGVRLPSC